MQARLSRSLLPSVIGAAGALFTVAAVVACADLPDIPRSVCGNSVVEPALGEECDGAVPAALVSLCEQEDPACELRCGAPTEAHACQLVWEEGGPRCPPGFFPAADGQCNRPSGHFRGEPIARVPVEGVEGLLGDIDGDGVDDITVIDGTGTPHITFLSKDGVATLTTTTFPGLVSLGRLSNDLDRDTTDDLIVPGGPALVTLLGPDLAPKAYAPLKLEESGAHVFARPIEPNVPANGKIPAGFDAPVRMRVEGDDVSFTQIDPQTFAKPTQAVGEITFTGLGAPISDPVFADLLAPLGPTTGAIGVEVVVASADKLMVSAADGNPVEVPGLDPGEKITGLFRLPPNQSHEVAITTEGPLLKRRVRLVARGLLPGAAPDLEPAGGISLEGASDASEVVLAIGDINGDGNVDVVTSARILFASPIAQGFADAAGVGHSWARAEIADLHGDGTLEVVALPAAGGVEVLQQGTKWQMSPTTVDLGGIATDLAVGDFDGDGADDVVVTKRGPQADTKDPVAYCKDADEIYAMFGRSLGLPEPPVLIGKIPRIIRLQPMRLYLPALLDGVTDLLVETGCSPERTKVTSGGAHVGIFFGSPTRRVFAPFSPYAGHLDQEAYVERAVIGDLGSVGVDGLGPIDGHADVALVATRERGPNEYQRELRVVPSQGEAELIDVGAAFWFGPKLASKQAFLDYFPSIQIGDVREDWPGPEMVALAFAGDGDGVEGVLEIVGRDASGAPQFQEVPVTVSSQEAALARLRILDFDGDGHLDIVAVTTLSARVFESDGGVAFDEVPLSGVNILFDVARLTPPTCLGVTNVDDCVEGRGTLVANFVDLLGCPLGTTECKGLFHFDTFTFSVLVHDFDGDGLEDVAVTRQKEFELHHQCSVSETRSGRCGSSEDAASN